MTDLRCSVPEPQRLPWTETVDPAAGCSRSDPPLHAPSIRAAASEIVRMRPLLMPFLRPGRPRGSRRDVRTRALSSISERERASFQSIFIALGVRTLEPSRRRREHCKTYAGPGADERDEVGCVDGAPAFLGGLDQLECHGDPGGLGAGPLGDLGPLPDRGEGQLDGVGPSMNAVA